MFSGVDDVLVPLWGGFLYRQSFESPDTSLSAHADFEKCEHLSRLALEKDIDGVCINECVDLNRSNGYLEDGNLLHLPCTWFPNRIDSHVLERLVEYWVRIGVDLEYCNG